MTRHEIGVRIRRHQQVLDQANADTADHVRTCAWFARHQQRGPAVTADRLQGAVADLLRRLDDARETLLEGRLSDGRAQQAAATRRRLARIAAGGL